MDGRINEGMRAVGPAVKRRSSSILRHVATAAANATGTAAAPGTTADVEARGSTSGATAAIAGAGAGAGVGENRRNRLLNVAMRSKTAAAAVEGNSYEDEASRPETLGYFVAVLYRYTHRLGGATWNWSNIRERGRCFVRASGSCYCCRLHDEGSVLKKETAMIG